MILKEALIVFCLIILNGFFAMAELAIISARKTRLQSEANQGNRRAKIALQVCDRPKRLLSTVQVGITFVSVIASVYGGVAIANSVHEYLQTHQIPAHYSWPISYGFVVFTITYFSLVIGELLPKRIALAYPERVAKAVSPMVQLFATLFRPFVWILNRSTDSLERMLGVQSKPDLSSIEDEIRIMIAKGTEVGIIEKFEENIVRKAFRLDDRTAASIMTPRTDLVWIDCNDPIESIWNEISNSEHSYFPLAEGSCEKILGIVSLKDISKYYLEHRSDGLLSLVREPIRVESNMSALRVLEQFKREKTHFAIVYDEYGGLDGMITTHDLMEALVGDLSDSPQDEPDYVRRADGSLLVEAGMDLAEVFGLLELPLLDHEDHRGYHSLGGFVMKQLGHVPMEGESFYFMGFTFEVVDMDKHRVDKVLVFRGEAPKKVT